VTVNGRRAGKGQMLKPGDAVHVTELSEVDDPRVVPQPDLPLAMLGVSASWVAVDKPAGWPTQPIRPGETGTLANALAARHPECFQVGERDTGMGGLLHRLDRQTSGVVLAARTQTAWEELRAQFARRAVEKTYLALVAGRLEGPARIATPLAHDPRRPGRMCPGTEDAGLPAETRVEPVRNFGGLSLVRATIRTGVTHQVRCHLALLGHPIVGDRLYGGPPAGPGCDSRRHFLHAAAISFPDPDGGGAIRIVSPVPPEMWGHGGWQGPI